eukprot:2255349-Karenia_brevis.AAC.1
MECMVVLLCQNFCLLPMGQKWVDPPKCSMNSASERTMHCHPLTSTSCPWLLEVKKGCHGYA